MSRQYIVPTFGLETNPETFQARLEAWAGHYGVDVADLVAGDIQPLPFGNHGFTDVQRDWLQARIATGATKIVCSFASTVVPWCNATVTLDADVAISWAESFCRGDLWWFVSCRTAS